MTGSSPQFLWIALIFCVACEPSATRNDVTVPIGANTGQAAPEVVSVKPKNKEGASQKTGDKVMFVRDARVDCEGEGPMLCMQVREAESDEWSLFYGKIEGFSYEEGYAYELRVRTEDVANPQADRSSRIVRLVEIVSKKKTPKP